MSIVDAPLQDRPTDLVRARRILFAAVAVCLFCSLLSLGRYLHEKEVTWESIGPLLVELFKVQRDSLGGGWGWVLPVLLFLAQASAIGYVFLLSPRVRIASEQQKIASEKQKIASAAVEQFYFWWKALWASWLGLYLGMAFLAVAGHWQGGAPTYGSLAITPLFNLSTLVMGALYVSMTRSTIQADAPRSPPASLRKPAAWVWLLTPFMPPGRVVGSVAGAGLRRYLLWGAAALVTFSLLEAGCTAALGEKHEYLVVFKWLGGFAGGVVFALFVGRLDSKRLDTPSRLLVLLYLYAVIQPGYAVFDSAFGWLVLTNLALYLKCLLFLQVSRQLESGAMLYYMRSVRELIDHGESMRQTFLTSGEQADGVVDAANAPWQTAVVEWVGQDEARCRVTIHGTQYPVSLPADVLRQHNLEPAMPFQLRLGRAGRIGVDDVKPLAAAQEAAGDVSAVFMKLNAAINSDVWSNPPQSKLPWKPLEKH